MLHKLSVAIGGAGFFVIAFTLALLLAPTSFERPCLALQAGSETEPQKTRPLEISWEEADSHRLDPRPVLHTNLGFPGDTKVQKRGLGVCVVIEPDGAMSQATGVVDSAAPLDLLNQAVVAVRGLHYRPFMRDGHPVRVLFTEYIRVQMPPLQSVPFPEVEDWSSVRTTLVRTDTGGVPRSVSDL